MAKDLYESHGMKGTPEYNTWRNIKERCHNSNHPRFKDYGGRGITVCDSWFASFSAFFADMGFRPKGMTLERIDNDKGYSPKNCKWATQAEQNRNQRNRIDNTSGVKGVSFNKVSQKFSAYISVNKKIIKLGLFGSLVEATQARDDAKLIYWKVKE